MSEIPGEHKKVRGVAAMRETEKQEKAAVSPVRVCLVGPLGKMGSQAVGWFQQWPDLELVAVVARKRQSQPDDGLQSQSLPLLKELLPAASQWPAGDLPLSFDLQAALQASGATVLLDLTSPEAGFQHGSLALQCGVAPVLGASGLTLDQQAGLQAESLRAAVPALWVPNFSLGAALQLKLAQAAARYFPAIEIIESHHQEKKDAPSATALVTARSLLHSAGAKSRPIPVHSVRLPGIVAEQKILFGGFGETLTLEHRVSDRAAYQHGVALALRSVLGLQGFQVGLASLLE